jgi:UDPglucose 6-dehydrogenase
MREAPSLVLIRELLARGASVCAYDPVAVHEAKRMLGDNPRIRYAERRWQRWTAPMHWPSSPSGRNSAAPTSRRSRRRLKTPVIFDGRNLYEPAAPRRAGLEYYAIGRL